MKTAIHQKKSVRGSLSRTATFFHFLLLFVKMLARTLTTGGMQSEINFKESEF